MLYNISIQNNKILYQQWLQKINLQKKITDVFNPLVDAAVVPMKVMVTPEPD